MLGPDETPGAPPALLELLRVRRVEMPAGTGDVDRWGEITPEQLAAIQSQYVCGMRNLDSSSSERTTSLTNAIAISCSSPDGVSM